MMINKQAILIIAHNNIWTLKKILQILDSEFFDIFIHIDKKSSIDFENKLKDCCSKSKLFIYKEIDVRWADFTQVECELFLIENALKINSNYSYLHLISGVDMPIKNAKYIYDFFENNNGKEFVHFENNSIPNKKLDWIKYYYFFGRISRKYKFFKLLDKISVILQKIFLVNRLKKSNKKIMTGANWFSITNKFSEYVLSNKSYIYKTFKYTRSADEIFLQTLLYNSNFINNLYYNKFDNNYTSILRLIDWERGNPYVFTEEDYSMIFSSNCLFARKFDEKKDSNIINIIYNNIKKEVKDNENWNYNNY